jgi:hypothetical protein
MPDNSDIEWRPITPTDPPDGAIVLTRINGGLLGVRNEQRLMRVGQTWLAADAKSAPEQPNEYAATPRPKE